MPVSAMTENPYQSPGWESPCAGQPSASRRLKILVVIYFALAIIKGLQELLLG
jgi:hypothetical protein